MWYLYQAIVTGILALLMVNLILNLRSLHRLGRDREELPTPPPLASVLIPARNEESNIGNCLESLRRQDYPNYEVIVLDDNSKDNTASIVESIAAVDHRIRFLKGKPLAPGWAGKSYACHQLSAEAQGEWLLFTDADTVHAPEMLSSAVAYAQGNELALLSGFPLQHTDSFSQRIAIPMMYFFILSFFPLWWLQGSRKPKPGIAIGQFLFFNAEDYRAIGGHETVKSRILEDVWLGVEIVRHGKRHGVVDLSQVVACRMYEGVGELWEGVGKWLYSVSAFSPLIFGLALMVLCGLFIAPFFLIASHFTPFLPAYGWSVLIIMQVAVILLMRALIDYRFQHSRRYSLLHPAGLSFWLLCGVHGAFKRFTGVGTSWKERRYKPESEVE